MPTRVYAVGNTEATGQTIESDSQRTVLIVQNLDTVSGTDWLYISDERGNVATTGIRLAPVGGSITLRKSHGEEPEKTWYLVAATAACPVRVMDLHGTPVVDIEEEIEPSPQEPPSAQVIDAPPMERGQRIRSGYGRTGGRRV